MSRLKKLSHTVWDCKYHVVWCPKYRFRVMEQALRYYVFVRLRKKYYGQHFWSRGYCVSTVGMNEEEIRKYVRWQQKKDREEDAAEQQKLMLE